MFKTITKSSSIGKSALAAILFSATLFGGAIPVSASGDNAVVGDATRGQSLFKRCAACHRIGPNAKNAVGPELNLIIGRPAGSVDGYRYGTGLTAANQAGLVWNTENLVEYIMNPKVFVRSFLDDNSARVKMTFRMRKQVDAQDVIAYLASLQEE
ncbi:Cytochrome c2 [hydrothermal vent metagenome]|uniref:Cytochrome c2 n=1 Tax=hydrothermal vent metagenome TaxID=652676 RepID=A0A3B0TY06_9ZZZZ